MEYLNENLSLKSDSIKKLVLEILGFEEIGKKLIFTIPSHSMSILEFKKQFPNSKNSDYNKICFLSENEIYNEDTLYLPDDLLFLMVDEIIFHPNKFLKNDFSLKQDEIKKLFLQLISFNDLCEELKFIIPSQHMTRSEFESFHEDYEGYFDLSDFEEVCFEDAETFCNQKTLDHWISLDEDGRDDRTIVYLIAEKILSSVKNRKFINYLVK